MHASENVNGESTIALNETFKYFAFISYSRKDSRAAKWLQRRLEWFRFPVKLVAKDRRPADSRYIRQVYRDKTNLEVDHQHYWENIKRSVAESRFLIVLCSPDAAKSKPVNLEVNHFLQSRRGAVAWVVPVILRGHVGCGTTEECLCPSLLELGTQIQDRNLPTMVPDVGDSEGDGWENGFVGVVSYLLNLQRQALLDHVRREERRKALVARFIAVVMGVLAVCAILGGWIALRERRRAEKEADTANLARVQADSNLSDAFLEKGDKADLEGDYAKAEVYFAKALTLRDDPRTRWKLLGARNNDWMVGWTSGYRVGEIDVSFGCNDRLVVTGSDDGHVRLWDTEAERTIMSLGNHKGPVRCVAFESQGQTMVTGGDDGLVRLWVAVNGLTDDMIRRAPQDFCFVGHQGRVTDVAMENGPGRIASVGVDGTCRLWKTNWSDAKAPDDLKSTQLLAIDTKLTDLKSVCFLPGEEMVAVAGSEPVIRCWNIKSGLLQQEIRTRAMPTAMASAKGILAIAEENGQITLHHLGNAEGKRVIAAHQQIITSLSLTPDGSRMVTTATDGTVKVWKCDGGGTLIDETKADFSVSSASISNDGQRVVFTGQNPTVHEWKLGIGTSPKIWGGWATPCEAIAVDRQNNKVLSGHWDGALRVWDLSTGALLKTINAFSHPVECVAWSSDGKMAAARGGTGGTHADVALFNFETDQIIWTNGMSYAKALSFSADGAKLVGVTNSAIRQWDTRTGESLGSTAQANSSLRLAAVSGDGALALLPGKNETIRLWSTSENKLLSQFPGEAITAAAIGLDGVRILTGTGSGEVQLRRSDKTDQVFHYSGLKGRVISVAISPDLIHIAALDAEQNLCCWYAGSAVPTVRLTGVPAQTLAFSATGFSMCLGLQNGGVQFIRMDRRDAESQTWRIRNPRITSLAVDRQEHFLAVGGKGNIVELFDLKSGERVKELPAGKGGTVAIEFSPDAPLLATADMDGVRLISLPDAKEVGAFRLPHRDGMATDKQYIAEMKFSPDGGVLAVLDNDSHIYGWDPETQKMNVNLTEVGMFNSGFCILDQKRVGFSVFTNDAYVITSSDPFKPLTFSQRGYVWVCKVSADSKFLALGSSGAGYLRDVQTGALKSRFVPGPGEVKSLSFDRSNQVLAAGSGSDVSLWSAESGSLFLRFRATRGAISGIAFPGTAEEGILVTADSSDNVLRIWSMRALNIFLAKPPTLLLQEAHTATGLRLNNMSATRDP